MDAEVRETSTPGCFEIIPKVFRDERGTFVKTFSYSFFEKYGLNTDFKEQFFSISRKDVVRVYTFNYLQWITINWFIASMAKLLM